MWVERVLGNTADGMALSPGSVDFVDVAWDQCGRTLNGRTRTASLFACSFSPGSQLRHGDVLCDDGTCRIVVNVPPCEVIVARPATGREMALLCLELGNLHCTAQVTPSEVLFIEEALPMSILDHLKLEWSIESRRFQPTVIGTGPGVLLARANQGTRQ